MMSTIVPLSPVDRILEHSGYHATFGFRRHSPDFWHWHRGIEILFIHTGMAQTYSRTWRRALHSGGLIMAYADNEHGSNGDFYRTVVHFVPEMLPAESLNRVIKLLDSNECVYTSLNPGSASRLIWAARELSSLRNQPGNLPSVRALMGVIAAEIEVSLNQPWDSTDSALLQSVVGYMRSNIQSEEKLKWLADRFSISPVRLHQLFKSELGCSPHRYWLSLKLEHACRLLKSEQQIQDISASVGFQSLRGFQRAFQRAYQMSPSDYRSSLHPMREC